VARRFSYGLNRFVIFLKYYQSKLDAPDQAGTHISRGGRSLVDACPSSRRGILAYLALLAGSVFAGEVVLEYVWCLGRTLREE